MMAVMNAVFLNVNNLFTNLPPNEVIDICADTLYSLENRILQEINSFY